MKIVNGVEFSDEEYEKRMKKVEEYDIIFKDEELTKNFYESLRIKIIQNLPMDGVEVRLADEWMEQVCFNDSLGKNYFGSKEK